eukprot:NODE_703_length_5018_cov_0.326286.p2 type:complete len:477 gc:universal NODE_703_length_5018_cov_0.326286:2171-741(-)
MLRGIYVLITLVYSVSIDCPNIKNLAIGMRMDVKQPALYATLLSDCCTVAGITCVNQRVTGILFQSKLFDGTINATAIPSTLTSIQLRGMFLTGPFPQLPNSVTYIDLGNNLLSGEIPSLPSGLTYLSYFQNSLNGSLPSTLPTKLTALYGGTNMMSGTLQSVLPSTLNILRLSGNKYTGPIPTSFAKNMDFTAFGGNKFTGVLTLNQPKSFNIQDNLITDIVISDISLLTSCTLSNNPMLGSTNVAALGTKCTATGLYTLIALTTIANSATWTSIENSISSALADSAQFSYVCLDDFLDSDFSSTITEIPSSGTSKDLESSLGERKSGLSTEGYYSDGATAGESFSANTTRSQHITLCKWTMVYSKSSVIYEAESPTTTLVATYPTSILSATDSAAPYTSSILLVKSTTNSEIEITKSTSLSQFSGTSTKKVNSGTSLRKIASLTSIYSSVSSNSKSLQSKISQSKTSTSNSLLI